MTTGTKYHQTRDLDIAEIAKLIRREIKTAQTDPASPVPATAKIKVRIDRYSMGQSVDIYVEGMPDTWIYASTDPDPDYRDGRPGGDHTPTCKAATAALGEILWAYNYDNSDSQTDHYDVRFRGDVRIRNEAAVTTRPL